METNEMSIVMKTGSYNVIDDIAVRNGLQPWPEQAKLQIAELQATVAAQTAEINRLIDRLDHLERVVHKYINGDENA